MKTGVEFIDFCNFRGSTVASDARILDFGCGAGALVYKMIDAGFPNAEGYDIKDRPLVLRTESDRSRFYIQAEGGIPVPDNTYDFIFSSQVFEHVQDQDAAFREIIRVLKPGGVSVNIFPGNCRLVEPHIKVPLASFKPFRGRTWLLFWVSLGMRKENQKNLSVREAAEASYEYINSSVNYLSLRQYRRILTPLPITWSWEELKLRLSRDGALARAVRKLPLLRPLAELGVVAVRPFRSRVLVFQKNGKA